MTTAFVLSGGGSLGSVQVGMLLALAQRDITPDLVVGASVGAINAAWVAGRPGLDGARELAEVWRSVRREDVFPTRPLVGLLGFLGHTDHLVPANRLRSLLRRHLNYQRLEEAPIPVRVVTTEITTGNEIILDRGDAVDAVAASAAIPAVFPAVTFDGRQLVDGGVSNNAPISHAVEAGATTIYVLPTGYACTLPRTPRGALGMALQAITLLVQQRLAADVARFQGAVDLRVIPPLCPLNVSPINFSQTSQLIHRAQLSTAGWLDRGYRRVDQAAALLPHRHGPAGWTPQADHTEDSYIALPTSREVRDTTNTGSP
jgi:NTE family protein